MCVELDLASDLFLLAFAFGCLEDLFYEMIRKRKFEAVLDVRKV